MNNNEEVVVDLEILLDVTRQKLIAAMILNTELEAVVREFKFKLEQLEKKDNK